MRHVEYHTRNHFLPARVSSLGASLVRIRILGLLAVVLLAAPAPTSATTIFNITGVGCVSPFVLGLGVIGRGDCGGGQPYNVTGTLSIDVFGGPDGFSADPISAAGDNWVSSSFQINWSGPTSGSYVSGHLPDETEFVSHAEVFNDPAYGQELFTEVVSRSNVGLNNSQQFIYLFRFTHSTTWLTDLTFPEAAGLAPVSQDFSNRLEFGDLGYSLDDNLSIVSVRPGSLGGDFQLTSMTIQPAADPVPEPATLALVGLGMLGMRAARRRAVNQAGGGL